MAGEGDHKPTDNKFMREDLAEQMEEAQELLEDVKKKTEVSCYEVHQELMIQESGVGITCALIGIF